MKSRRFFFAAILAAFVAGACQTTEQAGTSYGEALTLTDTTQISAILADPEAFVGQRVLVTGTVVGVCENKGCWMDIASEVESEKIQIKVDDGVITFPLSARGHSALVEGIVERLDLSIEQQIEQGLHEAEEHGTEFDPDSITEPKTIYRIRGIGALIAE